MKKQLTLALLTATLLVGCADKGGSGSPETVVDTTETTQPPASGRSIDKDEVSSALLKVLTGAMTITHVEEYTDGPETKTVTVIDGEGNFEIRDSEEGTVRFVEGRRYLQSALVEELATTWILGVDAPEVDLPEADIHSSAVFDVFDIDLAECAEVGEITQSGDDWMLSCSDTDLTLTLDGGRIASISYDGTVLNYDYNAQDIRVPESYLEGQEAADALDLIAKSYLKVMLSTKAEAYKRAGDAMFASDTTISMERLVTMLAEEAKAEDDTYIVTGAGNTLTFTFDTCTVAVTFTESGGTVGEATCQ